MSMINADFPKIAVIGGGPAGMMAAGKAKELGADVTLFEHMGKLGKKLAITGKGRCNVTNASATQEFLENVPTNPRFLYAALSAFSPDDTVAFFEGLGVPLKTERGKRVFPVSDKAIDVVNALRHYISEVTIRYENVIKIEKENVTFSVMTEKGSYSFDRVILATGGLSYPLTGCNGSGFQLAKALGHSVTVLSPSLVPIESTDPICKELQGLTLKNVAVSITENQKTVYSDFGEMMFTHFGITGPMVLSASSHLHGKSIKNLIFHIDLKPALSEEVLDKRLLSDFDARQNKDIQNALDALLPQKMQLPFILKTGIDPRKKVNSISKTERYSILTTLKDFQIPLKGFRPIDEAIITSGGINVKEINPKTMESKLVSGLYFAGEMIDVDAYTGGFNLQIAFSTGYLAGTHCAIS